MSERITARAKAVFFDLGETLVTQNIEDNLVTMKALEKISKILPRHKSPSDLFRIYKQGYKVNEAFRSKHHVEIPIQAWMVQLLRRALGEEPDDLTEEATKIIISARAENAMVFPDSKRLLERLSKRRIKLGIISNVSSHEVAVEILRKVGLLDYFRTVVTSAFVGIRKPDPGIFLYALTQFKLQPREAVIVGDSERHDVWGGTITGMKTVLVSKRPVTDSIADYHFTSLAEASDTLTSL
ncbi:MAG TPA: HAD family hydrolase [Candidatus Bathyarchaeia archaeon]|nr:HAD family hydrolase [Candidatus Bathyarchaeia archaeon]